MSIASASALVDLLRRYHLLTPQQLGSLPLSRPGQNQDARTLAKALVQRGWLTVYQINQLLAGHGGDLILGSYQILDRLGQGGQSLVYKARHSENADCLVALKVIRSELLDNPEARRQFLQEMEAMAQLDHPNIVQFCDADQAGETFYCAMEYVEGTDLGKFVRLSGPLPPAQASDYIRQTALGLQHAHEHSLVHRDIKPVNLFLTIEQSPPPRQPFAAPPPPPPSVIKILDWGLACLRPPGPQATSCEQVPAGRSSILGTADYLSPEQACNANKADIRSDIYSLGCTFYYLLTGQPPFAGGTLVEKLMQHQQAAPPPVEALNPDVTPALNAVLQRMMAKKPEDRYRTPAAVALALTSFSRKAQSAGEPVRREPRPAPPAEPTKAYDDTPVPAALRGERGAQRPLPSGRGADAAHADTRFQ